MSAEERRIEKVYFDINPLFHLDPRSPSSPNPFALCPAADALRNDRIATMLQTRQERDQRALNEALNEFRALHQQPSSRREWDLYDPDYLKKDKPARVHDDDPRCGISSIQKFDGEDLNSKVSHGPFLTHLWCLWSFLNSIMAIYCSLVSCWNNIISCKKYKIMWLK